MAEGNNKDLMLKAFADMMGGYLQAFVVPLTKSSFYAGNVKYCKAVKIFKLLKGIKAFLNTNGVGWKEPQPMDTLVEVTSLNVSDRGSLEACNDLVVDSPSKSNNNNFLEHHKNLKTEKLVLSILREISLQEETKEKNY